MPYYLPWLANSSGGSDAYTWYTDLDKSTIPFHAGAGDWGVQSTIKEAAAPVTTSTGTAGTFAQLRDALYTGGVQITLTADIDGGIFNADDIIDSDVIIPSGITLANIEVGAYDGGSPSGSTVVQRLRFRGSTFGSYGSGGQLHKFGAYAPINDLIIDGLDLTGPGGNAGCISIQRLGYTRAAARMSVTNCKGNSGGWIYFGDMGDTVWANCSFLTGSDNVNVAEAWGWRFDLPSGGNHVIYKVDCRQNTIRGTSFGFPRIRVCPHASASPQYVWFSQNQFTARVESYILWQSSQSGNSGIDGGNYLGSWFQNNEIVATNGVALLSVRDALYARVTNNTFKSDTFTSDSQIVRDYAPPDGEGQGEESGVDDYAASGNSYQSLPGSDSAWIGPGDPSSLDWSSW